MNFVKEFFLLSTMVMLSACAGSNSDVEPAVAQSPVKKISLNSFVCPDDRDTFAGKVLDLLVTRPCCPHRDRLQIAFSLQWSPVPI